MAHVDVISLAVLLFLQAFTAHAQDPAAPVWSETLEDRLSVTGVQEDVTTGTLLGTLLAVDPQGQTVTYSTTSSVVAVDSGSGNVRLQQALDMELNSFIPLQFSASDSAGNTVTVEYDLRVVGIQDTPPRFDNTPISYSILENEPVSTNFEPVIRVRDGDAGPRRELLVELINNPNQLIAIELVSTSTARVYEYRLRTAAVLDYETQTTIELTIRATELDNGVATDVFTDTIVTINVNDVNDNGPVFSETTYSVMLDESPARGSAIPGLNVQVSDADSSRFAVLSLSIQDVAGNTFPQPKAEIYTLSTQEVAGSAAVTLRVSQPLYFDYEIPLYREHIFEIVARETQTSQQRSSTATVVVRLRDINDNFPQFEQSIYRSTVPEDRPVGDYITTVSAIDLDGPSFNQLTYSLSGTGSHSFNINEATGDVTIAQPLDFEVRSIYQLDVTATDSGGLSVVVRYVITVQDFNDQAPVFSADQYSAFVDEGTNVLNPSITVQATDADTDLAVTYSIVAGNDQGLFTLDPTTGVFRLTRPVRYQQTNGVGFFEVTVQASDNDDPTPQTTTVPVIINVRDENDNAPAFSQLTYTGTVHELSPPGRSVVTVDATDLDAGLNAHIDYIIRSGSADNFVIDNDSGLITVADGADLDIDTNGDMYTVLVHAIDRGSPQQTGTATVSINVIDSNNKNPEFDRDVYLLSVQEDAPLNTVIDVITATDDDTNSSLTYRINMTSIAATGPLDTPITDQTVFDYMNAFGVNPDTGEIFVNTSLDYDVIRRVQFMLLVQDVFGETETDQLGSASVEIVILEAGGTEVTFQPPWNDPEYVISIPEEQDVGTVITVIVADDPVTGGTITDYRKVSGTDPNNYFIVNQDTGEIAINRLLDYEAGAREVSFQVQAFTAAPDVRSAAATLRVIVEDINDNLPVFEPPSYEDLRLPEDAEPGAEVGTVSASDGDSGNHSAIVYSLTGAGAENFDIDPETGVISVSENATLDREEISEFRLTAVAADNPDGDVSRSDSARVIIRLDDVNDNAPTFARPEVEIRTADQREKDRILGAVSASDPDLGANGRVEYSMIQGDPQLFRVQTNGTIRVNRDPSLEGTASVTPYVIVVRAQDSGSPQLYSDVTVRIYVQDSQFNERPTIDYPGQDGDAVNLTEEVAPGTNVTQIEASSRDPGTRLTFTFIVNDELAEDASKFDIDPDTGVITVKDQLDRETQDVYELIVMVRDNNNPPGETVRRIFVNLTDINDNRPSFECPGSPRADPLLASVPENRNMTRVTQVLACDADESDANAIYFLIIAGNDVDTYFGSQRPFLVDNSGVIYTNVPLDREHRPVYELTVQALNLPDDAVMSTNNSATQRRRRDAHDDDDSADTTATRTDVIRVRVEVLDEDDNGPTFGEGQGATAQRIVEGVLATARAGTEITQVRAGDADVYASNTYSLQDYVVIDKDNDRKSVPYAFVIDAMSGVIETNLEDYIKYVDGYFQMTIVATDNQNRQATATLIIHVIRGTQRLRFIFDQSPDDVIKRLDPFLVDVSEEFTNLDINADSVHYHARSHGRINYDMSDVCFHVVRDNRVLNADTARDEFRARERTSATLRQVYTNYSMVDIKVCEVKVTTDDWDGWDWLWWWLIALALFILLMTLICICCICYCWSRYWRRGYYKKEKRPYRVYEGSTILPPASEYEWQEEVVKMH